MVWWTRCRLLLTRRKTSKACERDCERDCGGMTCERRCREVIISCTFISRFSRKRETARTLIEATLVSKPHHSKEKARRFSLWVQLFHRALKLYFRPFELQNGNTENILSVQVWLQLNFWYYQLWPKLFHTALRLEIWKRSSFISTPLTQGRLSSYRDGTLGTRLHTCPEKNLKVMTSWYFCDYPSRVIDCHVFKILRHSVEGTQKSILNDRRLVKVFKSLFKSVKTKKSDKSNPCYVH